MRYQSRQQFRGLVVMDEDAMSEENIQKLELLGFVVVRQKSNRKVEIHTFLDDFFGEGEDDE